MPNSTLAVVYKKDNALIFEQLKRLIYAKDGLGISYDGAKDKTVLVVGYTEKEWQKLIKSNERVRYDRIIFLDSKGTADLCPSLDFAFNKFGVTYGFIGKYVFVFTTLKAIRSLKTRKSFNKAFSDLYYSKIDTHKDLYGDWIAEESKRIATKSAVTSLLFKASSAIEAVNILDALTDVLPNNSNSFMQDYLLMYGVMNLYFNDLIDFINS